MNTILRRFIQFGIVMLVFDLVLLIIYMGSIIYSIRSVRQFVRLATVRLPETFTELYFENHTKLPKYVSKYTDYPYSFTIHNLEHKDMKYQIEIFIVKDQQKIPLESGAVTLKHDEFKTIKKVLRQDEPKGRVKVVVKLVNLNQQIDYWIET